MLEVELPSEMVSEKFKEVYAELSKKASIPGFRTGKVPQDLLEKHYGKTAKDEVTQRLILESCEKAVRESNLLPISSPRIKDVQLQGKNTFSFKAEIEIRPQVKLKTYKNLKIKRKKLEVSDKDIEEALLRLQQMRAQSSAEKELPPLDDKFAQDVANCKNLAELKILIRNDIVRHNQAEEKADMRSQLSEQLLKNNTFNCPPSLIEEELRHMVNQAKVRLIYQGVEKGKVVAEEEKMKERLRPQAVNHVRLSFVLDEIARQEDISVSPKEVEGALKSIEGETGQKINSRKRGLIDNLRFQLREEKTINFLLKEAKVTV